MWLWRPGFCAGFFYLSATAGKAIIFFGFAGVHVSLDIYQWPMSPIGDLGLDCVNLT